MNEISVASLDELQHLKAKVKWMDVLMKQNAALEGEVSRLCGELDEATRGVLKRGYLYKYRYAISQFILMSAQVSAVLPFQTLFLLAECKPHGFLIIEIPHLFSP